MRSVVLDFVNEVVDDEQFVLRLDVSQATLHSSNRDIAAHIIEIAHFTIAVNLHRIISRLERLARIDSAFAGRS